MIDEKPIALRFEAVRPSLDERARRLHVAAEAHSAGHGGDGARQRRRAQHHRARPQGPAGCNAGAWPGAPARRWPAQADCQGSDAADGSGEAAGAGDDGRSDAVRWVSKSHDKLATALCEMGHQVSASSLPKLLEALGYRRHVNRKTKDGGSHPDRDAQFECINAKAREFQAAGQPVVSVDTKKKALI